MGIERNRPDGTEFILAQWSDYDDHTRGQCSVDDDQEGKEEKLMIRGLNCSPLRGDEANYLPLALHPSFDKFDQSFGGSRRALPLHRRL